MSTASTATVLDHTGDAGYRAWIAEIIAQFLAVGLTQTADTGQVNTATVTRPAISTLNAYAIFRFNDALHATNPIFFKLDFGTATVANIPQMRVTVGRGSNGSGTITGLVMTRVGITAGPVPASTVVPYTSRFCYNATQGFFGFVWKIGAQSMADRSYGGFAIFRSTDANGDPTSDSTMLLANQSTDGAGAASSPGYMQVISHLASTAYITTPFPTAAYSTNGAPLALTGTLYSGNAQVFPIWQYTPILGVSNQLAIGLNTEIAYNSTVSLALVGSTPHTYLNVNTMVGLTSTFGGGFTPASHSFLMLWE